MHGPPLVGWLLVAVCALAGTVCLVRASAVLRGGQRHAAGVEALMGFAMALMAVPGASLPTVVYVALFAGLALWTVVWWSWEAGAWPRSAQARPSRWPPLVRPSRARWPTHQPHHLLEAGAMLYVTLTMPITGDAGAHTGHGAGGTGVPVLSAVLAGYFVLYALRHAAALASVPAPAHAATASASPTPVRLVAPPELATACRVALALAMATMLLV